MRTIAERPDAEAVVDGPIRVTYRELSDRVLKATKAMISAGIVVGDRVAIWAPNSLGWIVAALGAQSAGAAIVPINTRWKGSEAAFVLANAKVSILCTSIGFLTTDTVAMLDADATPLPNLRKIVLLPGSEPTSAQQAAQREVVVEPWADFEAAAEAVSHQEAQARTSAVQPTDTSDILFTSGTTGRPKGVVMTHAQTVRQFTDWCDFSGLEPGDRYLIVNPFFHMFGYKAGWLACLIRGATIFPVAVFDVPAVLALVQAEKITVLPGAPTIYRSILDHPDRDQYELGSLRIAVTGAADVPVTLIEQMRAELPFTTILTGYGLTEAGTVTGSRREDDATTIATTAGRAMPDLEVLIADPHGIEVERGVTGELLVRGFGVMQHYLDDPDATAANVEPKGFLHTGDLATMDERGYVRIVGRLKDMIIVGGFNVYPAEIENMMLTHPDIAQVAVIGVPDERMGEVGMAWLVPVSGRTLASDEIIQWSRAAMANYKVPRFVRVVDSLPINASGKILKEELRARAADSS
jgi:HIP---CoA ligase